ncbi:hypothetical protein GCM10023211_09310 [Orbus sasakiae]|uniref:Uncharacterized protein n=1 Tax=Orbus sasakiae TaxID=1078475 RepID=A0ABP9N8U4_9GAMM
MTNAHSTAKTAKTKTTGKTLQEPSQRHYTVGYINVRHEPKASPTKPHYSKNTLLCILKVTGLRKLDLQQGNQ